MEGDTVSARIQSNEVKAIGRDMIAIGKTLQSDGEKAHRFKMSTLEMIRYLKRNQERINIIVKTLEQEQALAELNSGGQKTI